MFYAVAPFRNQFRNKVLNIQTKSEDEDNLIRAARVDLQQLLQPLESLIGLNEVKRAAEELCAYYSVCEWRKRYHLRTDIPVYHMVFYGPPGTGKTTVARLFGEIFSALGLLEKGHVLEVERADLVGEYIGHTAQKTRFALEQARGGILFIDEAYSLARGGDKDFGREVIDTLVKGMEEMKKELVVILAGYEEEMAYFLTLNPGLSSRFPVKLEFSPFLENELIDISMQVAREKDYQISADGLYELRRKIRNHMIEPGFGNGRTVRNMIERAIRKQAYRIMQENQFDRNRLMMLIASDFS